MRLAAREVRADSAAAAAAAAAAAREECQPNADAPLLQSEAARRAWVEEQIRECCTVRSFT